jgi:curli biogenesis system outer membrane secretion channel CsgG
MADDGRKITHPISKAWNWLRDQIVQPVPESSALCEFDCRKQQCTMGEWENCDRRLTQAAGELMPASKKAAPPQP